MAATTAPDDLAPFYRCHVFACTNERPGGSCKRRGGEMLRNCMKVRAKELGLADVRISGAGGLDRCELGPTIVVYPGGVWYTARTSTDIDEVLRTHLIAGDRVHRLMLLPKQMEPRA